MLLDDNIDNSVQEPLIKRYPYLEFPFLYQEIKRDNGIDLEDLILINRILVGCTKLTYEKKIDFLKSGLYKSELSPKSSRKSIGSLQTFQHLLNKNNENSFRANNIRQIFDQEIQNISSADLSKILRIFKKVGAIDKTKTKGSAIPRGRPRNNVESQKISGPKEHYYSETDYLSKLKKLITNPKVRIAIYSILLESNILREYLKYSVLHALYQLKSQDLDSTLKNDKVVCKLDEQSVNEMKFRLSDLHRSLLSSDKKQIEKIAQTIVLDYMRRQEFYNDFYDLFYLTGGLYFKK